MQRFGDVIRLLMERRGISGRQLSAAIEISPTSVSKIVTGQSKPRQMTLTRLIRSLCTTPDEEQMVIRSFTGLTDSTPDEPDKLPRPIPPDEVERVTRYLEVKSMSVAFKKDVESVLQAEGLPFQKDFQVDPFICDFMLELKGRRVAVDCKYNVNRDWDRTLTTVALLHENLPCDDVVIVVPYENELTRKARPKIETAGNRVIDIKEFVTYLRS